jgi:hypothetical protein
VIGDYTEEALSGHDIKVTGQIPYIPWAKIKGTHYYWDQSAGGSINGSILGVEVQLSGMNKRLNPHIESLFMTPAEQYANISYSLVSGSKEPG